MTTKVYGIYGRTTAIVRIPTNGGKAHLEVEFTRGVPNAGPNYRPATFSTSDPVVQDILEKSKLFKTLFTIYRVTHSEDKKAGEKAAPAPKKVELEQLDEITSIEEAVSYLKAKGAKAIQLKDNNAIKKFAEKIGVSFPNLNL